MCVLAMMNCSERHRSFGLKLVTQFCRTRRGRNDAAARDINLARQDEIVTDCSQLQAECIFLLPGQ